MKYVVFDIDGCIADDRHRRHLLPEQGEKGEARQKAYDAYHLSSMGDILANVDVLEQVIAEGRSIIYLTGRPDTFRSITEQWLAQNKLPIRFQDELLMRPRGNREPAPQLKVKILMKHIRMNGLPIDDIVECYDNNEEIIAAYKEAGFNAHLLTVEDYFARATNPVEPTDAQLGASGPVEQNKSEVWAILEDAAQTYKERNAVYGDNYLSVAPVMAAMFPNGTPEGLPFATHFHLFELVIVKLTRFANSNLKHIDSIHDACVYSAMIESILRKEQK